MLYQWWLCAIRVICHLLRDRYKICHFLSRFMVQIPSSVLIVWQRNWRWRFQFRVDRCLETVCLVLAFFDDEYVVDPYVVELRSKTKPSIEGHMFWPHLVKVHSMTKSSNEGHMFRPHLVKVHSETKSSNEGHILDHIWSKSAVRQSPLIRAHFGPHLVKVCTETKSSKERHILDHI